MTRSAATMGCSAGSPCLRWSTLAQCLTAEEGHACSRHHARVLAHSEQGRAARVSIEGTIFGCTHRPQTPDPDPRTLSQQAL